MTLVYTMSDLPTELGRHNSTGNDGNTNADEEKFEYLDIPSMTASHDFAGRGTGRLWTWSGAYATLSYFIPGAGSALTTQTMQIPLLSGDYGGQGFDLCRIINNPDLGDIAIVWLEGQTPHVYAASVGAGCTANSIMRPNSNVPGPVSISGPVASIQNCTMYVPDAAAVILGRTPRALPANYWRFPTAAFPQCWWPPRLVYTATGGPSATYLSATVTVNNHTYPNGVLTKVPLYSGGMASDVSGGSVTFYLSVSNPGWLPTGTPYDAISCDIVITTTTTPITITQNLTIDNVGRVPYPYLIPGNVLTGGLFSGMVGSVPIIPLSTSAITFSALPTIAWNGAAFTFTWPTAPTIVGDANGNGFTTSIIVQNDFSNNTNQGNTTFVSGKPATFTPTKFAFAYKATARARLTYVPNASSFWDHSPAYETLLTATVSP